MLCLGCDHPLTIGDELGMETKTGPVTALKGYTRRVKVTRRYRCVHCQAEQTITQELTKPSPLTWKELEQRRNAPGSDTGGGQ